MSEGNSTPTYFQGNQQGTIQQMRQYQHQCRICGVSERLRRCSRCQVAYYCSQEHQRQDWRSHKPGCRSIHQLQQVPASTAGVLVPQTTDDQPQQYAISRNLGIYQNNTIAGPTNTSVTTMGAEEMMGDAQTSMMTTQQPTSSLGGVFENDSGVRAELLSTNEVQSTNTRMSPMRNTQPFNQPQQQQLQQQQQQHSPQSQSSQSSGGSPLLSPATPQASTSSSASSPASAVMGIGDVDIGGVAEELLLNENAVSNLFPADPLADVQQLVELDQLDVDHILNENNFLNNINNLNFFDEILDENLVSGPSIGSGSATASDSGIILPIGEMQLTQPSVATALHHQQQQLIGSGTNSPVMFDNNSTRSSLMGMDENVSAMLDARIGNLMAYGRSRSRITSLGKPRLTNWEKDALEESCNNLIHDLDCFGVCVMDNFLGHELGLKVLQEVKNMYSSGVFEVEDGQLASNEAGTNSQHIRGDKIVWIDGGERDCENIGILTTKVDDLVLTARRKVVSGKLGRYNIKQRTKAMVACYPGHGSHYIKHVDNPSKDGRCITAIYYLNLDWDVRTSGGLLRIFPEDRNDHVADIEPVFDRILFFWSDRRNPHEVQPSHRTRYAITLWYLDAVERWSARLRYQQSRALPRFSA